MRKKTVCFTLLVLLTVSGEATAVIGTIDDVPAATLLLPYFEVCPGRRTTLFSITNAFFPPVLAHVTLWTDLAVPTLDFNVYLQGGDVATFNLLDIFQKGLIPRTSNSKGSNSPMGAFSLTNGLTARGPSLANCGGLLPPLDLPTFLLDHIQKAHSGQPTTGPIGLQCEGIDYGDGCYRGYVTIDNVNGCSLLFPNDPGYFVAGGTGVATNANQLLGDVQYVDLTAGRAQGETLVHIEADDSLGPRNYTFYRRFAPAGEDQREGLGSTFAVRYAVGGSIVADTDLVVWRDPKQPISSFPCSSPPQPFPLDQALLAFFNEMGLPYVPLTPPFPIMGWATQRVAVNGPLLPVPFSFGWALLDLNIPVSGSQVPFEPRSQSWVMVLTSAGPFSVGNDAYQLDNVTYP